MPTYYSGNITFLKDQRRVTVNLPHVSSMTALRVYAQFLHAYTNAAIESYSFIETEQPGTMGENPSKSYDIDWKALLTLRNTDPDPDGGRYTQTQIPAPKNAMFDEIEKVGIRVPSAIGALIAAAYSTMSGEPYDFSNGSVISR